MKLVISDLNDWVSRCCAAARLHAWLPGGEWFFLGRAGESVFSKLSSKMGACSNVLCRLTGLLTSAIPGISGVHFFSEICGNFILFSGFSREAIRKSFRLGGIEPLIVFFGDPDDSPLGLHGAIRSRKKDFV